MENIANFGVSVTHFVGKLLILGENHSLFGACNPFWG